MKEYLQQGVEKVYVSYNEDRFKDSLLKHDNLRAAADSNSQIKLRAINTMWVKAKSVTFGSPPEWVCSPVKVASGIEIGQTYNLLIHDQIVGMMMKKLV